MEVTNLPKASTDEAPEPGTSPAGRANMRRGRVEAAVAPPAALEAATRGPKVLQSRQARQRCLEFSRG